MDTYVIGAAAAVVVITQAVMWWITRKQRASLDALGERLRSLTTATSLLTDTMESALRDLIQHQAERPAPPKARPSSTNAAKARRITGAARRGLAVRDIAAAEELSEGEVRLRLKLSTPQDEDQVHDRR